MDIMLLPKLNTQQEGDGPQSKKEEGEKLPADGFYPAGASWHGLVHGQDAASSPFAAIRHQPWDSVEMTSASNAASSEGTKTKEDPYTTLRTATSSIPACHNACQIHGGTLGATALGPAHPSDNKQGKEVSAFAVVVVTLPQEMRLLQCPDSWKVHAMGM